MASGEPSNITLTLFHRFSMLFLIIAEFALFIFSLLLYSNYIDQLSFMPYPSLSTATSTDSHYVKNVSLYLLFWVQHIGMATLLFKKSWFKRWNNFVLYERYIYNIASAFTIWLIFTYLEPSNIYLFTVPDWIHLPLKIIGTCIHYTALWQLGDKLMTPWTMRQILTEKSLNYLPYGAETTGYLESNGLYGYIRNPMQTANLLLTFFGGNVYTIDRLLFSMTMGAAIIIGTMMEEKRMLKHSKGYREYMEKVKGRYIPFVSFV